MWSLEMKQRYFCGKTTETLRIFYQNMYISRMKYIRDVYLKYGIKVSFSLPLIKILGKSKIDFFKEAAITNFFYYYFIKKGLCSKTLAQLLHHTKIFKVIIVILHSLKPKRSNYQFSNKYFSLPDF